MSEGLIVSLLSINKMEKNSKGINYFNGHVILAQDETTTPDENIRVVNSIQLMMAMRVKFQGKGIKAASEE